MAAWTPLRLTSIWDLPPIRGITDFLLRLCTHSGSRGFDCFPTIPIRSANLKRTASKWSSAFPANPAGLTPREIICSQNLSNWATCWQASDYTYLSNSTFSKDQFQRELNFPGILRAGDDAKVGGPENSAGQIEIRMVQSIEAVHAEFQYLALAQTPFLLQ